MDAGLRKLVEEIIDSVLDKVEVGFPGLLEVDYELDIFDYDELTNDIADAIENYCERKLEAAKKEGE